MHDRKMSQLEQAMHMYLGRNYRGFWVLQEADKKGATTGLEPEAQVLSDPDAELYAKTLWLQMENFDQRAACRPPSKDGRRRRSVRRCGGARGSGQARHCSSPPRY